MFDKYPQLIRTCDISTIEVLARNRMKYIANHHCNAGLAELMYLEETDRNSNPVEWIHLIRQRSDSQEAWRRFEKALDEEAREIEQKRFGIYYY